MYINIKYIYSRVYTRCIYYIVIGVENKLVFVDREFTLHFYSIIVALFIKKFIMEEGINLSYHVDSLSHFCSGCTTSSGISHHECLFQIKLILSLLPGQSSDINVASGNQNVRLFASFYPEINKQEGKMQISITGGSSQALISSCELSGTSFTERQSDEFVMQRSGIVSRSSGFEASLGVTLWFGFCGAGPAALMETSTHSQRAPSTEA